MGKFWNSDNGLPKGGMIGALLGTLASTQMYKKEEPIAKKALKTGLLAGFGFAIGAFVEKMVKPKK